jgi:hypothetical protein
MQRYAHHKWIDSLNWKVIFRTNEQISASRHFTHALKLRTKGRLKVEVSEYGPKCKVAFKGSITSSGGCAFISCHNQGNHKTI